MALQRETLSIPYNVVVVRGTGIGGTVGLLTVVQPRGGKFLRNEK